MLKNMKQLVHNQRQERDEIHYLGVELGESHSSQVSVSSNSQRRATPPSSIAVEEKRDQE